jgi:hypothetical protein
MWREPETPTRLDQVCNGKSGGSGGDADSAATALAATVVTDGFVDPSEKLISHRGVAHTVRYMIVFLPIFY